MTSALDAPVRGRVLVIDDEVLIGRSIQRALAKTYDVVVADSGAQAIEVLRANPTFDCILCDLQMPEVAGEAVYEWATAHAAGLIDRFVFMTGGTFTEPARLFLARVRNERIEKPFEMAVLRAVVGRTCGSSAPGASS